MNVLAYALAAVLGLLGLVFVVGWQGLPARLVVGIVLFVAAGALVAMTRLRPRKTTVVQQLDLSAGAEQVQLHCESCGGSLGSDNFEIRHGSVFVACPYCGADYRIEEKVKW